MDKTREEFIAALQTQVEPNVFTHSLSVEACMGGMFDYLQSKNMLGMNDPPKTDWLLAGLIHDLDYGGEFKADHPLKLNDALEKYKLSISKTVENIIHAHAASYFNVRPTNKAEWAIYCIDSLTGLITAVTYVYPSRKIADVKVSSVVKRLLHQPKFAAGTRRNEIQECTNSDGLGIPVETFVEVCVRSMQNIASDIGL